MIQAVILAAGMGTRLGRPFPKPLTPLSDGRTIMEQQIDLAADHGIAFFSFDWYWYGSQAATENY